MGGELNSKNYSSTQFTIGSYYFNLQFDSVLLVMSCNMLFRLLFLI